MLNSDPNAQLTTSHLHVHPSVLDVSLSQLSLDRFCHQPSKHRLLTEVSLHAFTFLDPQMVKGPRLAS